MGQVRLGLPLRTLSTRHFQSGNPTQIVGALLGAPITIIDGFVNGGYGPNLASLLPTPPTVKIPPNCTGGPPACFTVQPTYGTIPGGWTYRWIEYLADRSLPLGCAAILQSRLERQYSGHAPRGAAIGDDASGGLSPSTMVAPLNTNTLRTSGTEDPVGKELPSTGNPTLTVDKSEAPPPVDDDPAVTPQKHRHLINVDVFNPLGNLGGAKKDTKDNVSSVNSNNDSPGKHRIGTPVSDLIHKVLGGSHDKDDNDEGSGDQDGRQPRRNSTQRTKSPPRQRGGLLVVADFCSRAAADAKQQPSRRNRRVQPRMA